VAGLIVAAAAVAGAGTARAQARPDSVEIAEILAARARVQSGRKPGYFDAPGWVMARSLVIPGWGQLHNGAWVKAGLVAAGETYLGLKVLREERDLDDLKAEVERLPVEDPQRNALVDDYNARLDAQTGRQWFLAAVVAYAMLDAYVDAHFRDFSLALEPGAEGGARVALRRTF